MVDAKKLNPWEILAAPFPIDKVGKLARYTGTKENKGKNKKWCDVCKSTHDHPAIHLDYIGHAEITTRLNEVDPAWTWEPMGFDSAGLPALDSNGCLWARMTVLGVTKPAYGDPGTDWQGNAKHTPDGMKEAIGDMIRNGAMRFGVGTYLWSKSERPVAEEDKPPVSPPANAPQKPQNRPQDAQAPKVASAPAKPTKAHSDALSRVAALGKRVMESGVSGEQLAAFVVKEKGKPTAELSEEELVSLERVMRVSYAKQLSDES